MSCSNSIQINEPTCQITSENSLQIGHGDAFQNQIQPNLFQQRLGKSFHHNGLSEGNVIPERGLLEFLVQFDDFEGEFIGEDATWFECASVLAPDCFEFEAGVLFDDLLDVFHVAGVEGWDDIVFDTHVL